MLRRLGSHRWDRCARGHTHADFGCPCACAGPWLLRAISAEERSTLFGRVTIVPLMRFDFARGIIVLAMAKRPTAKAKKRKTRKPGRRVHLASFSSGMSMQRAHPGRTFTHAYLVLYETPDVKRGFQRAFCSSLDEAEAKVEAEKLWLSKYRHTFIEAFIVEVQDITGQIKDKK
jgi:hypothetical protein